MKEEKKEETDRWNQKRGNEAMAVNKKMPYGGRKWRMCSETPATHTPRHRHTHIPIAPTYHFIIIRLPSDGPTHGTQQSSCGRPLCPRGFPSIDVSANAILVCLGPKFLAVSIALSTDRRLLHYGKISNTVLHIQMPPSPRHLRFLLRFRPSAIPLSLFRLRARDRSEFLTRARQVPVAQVDRTGFRVRFPPSFPSFPGLGRRRDGRGHDAFVALFDRTVVLPCAALQRIEGGRRSSGACRESSGRKNRECRVMERRGQDRAKKEKKEERQKAKANAINEKQENPRRLQ